VTASTLTRPAVASSPARRVNPFSQRGFKGVVRTEAKVWSRDPSAVFFGLVFPSLLILSITLMGTGVNEPLDMPGPYYGVTGVQLFVPAVLTMAIATPFLTILPAVFGAFREKGVLRRFSGSPMRPQALVAAHYLINLAVVVVASIAAVTIAHLAWGLTMPNNLGTVVLGFVLGTMAMAALATVVAARAPRASVASGVGTLLFFVLLITAGVFSGPGPLMGDTLATIAQFSPLGAAAQVMTIGWFESGFPLLQVLVMLGWTAVLLPIGIKLFHWK
jgi:ABC-2 type transport system permease protein